MGKRQYRTFNDCNLKKLQKTKEAKAYLTVALMEYEQDGDVDAFLMALRDVAEAQGGVTQLAERTQLSRQSLYKALSSKGNPRLDTLGTILHALGFRLSIEQASAH